MAAGEYIILNYIPTSLDSVSLGTTSLLGKYLGRISRLVHNIQDLRSGKNINVIQGYVCPSACYILKCCNFLIRRAVVTQTQT